MALPPLVSVVAVAGSAPREAGARIVLRPDGGFWGTVGGGALEWELIREARQALSAGRGPAQVRDWPLGPDLGQCCGGRVTIARRDVRPLRRRDRSPNSPRPKLEAAFETRDGPRRVRPGRRGVRLPIDDPDFLPPRQTDLRRPGGVIIERFGDDQHAGAALRGGPCRPRPGAGAGAASVPAALDRYARRCLPGAHPGQCRCGLHARRPMRRSRRRRPRRSS